MELLLLLFVGVAISVAVFGAFRAVEGSQSQAMTFHAQTQAQRKAWAGVDITSKYLSSLSSDNLEILIEALPSKSDSELPQQKLNAEIEDENIQFIFIKKKLMMMYLFMQKSQVKLQKIQRHMLPQP